MKRAVLLLPFLLLLACVSVLAAPVDEIDGVPALTEPTTDAAQAVEGATEVPSAETEGVVPGLTFEDRLLQIAPDVALLSCQPCRRDGDCVAPPNSSCECLASIGIPCCLCEFGI